MDCKINDKGALVIMRGEADIERVQYCRYIDNVCGDWCPHLVEKQVTIPVNDASRPGKQYTIYGTRHVVTSCAGHEMNLIEDRRV